MFHIIKNLAKHSAIYGMGDLLSKSIAFLMIPIYTHYLSTEQYGTLELLELTSYVVGMLLAMGISQSVVRYYYEYKDEETRNQVISVGLITIWLISVVALIPLFLISGLLSQVVFKSGDYATLFDIVFVTLVVGLSNEIPMTMLRIRQKSITYVAVNLSRLIISLSLNILFIVHFQMGVWGILVSSLTASVSVALFMLFYTVRGLKLTYSKPIARSLLTYSVPLIGSWIGAYVLNFGDRFFLQRLTTLSDVGIYSLAYKFGFMPNFLVLGPFLQIWGPKRFELVDEPDAKSIYSVVFTYFWFLELFLSLGLSVMIRDVLKIVAGPEFQSSYKYVPIILASYMIYGAYQYSQFGVLLQKKTKFLGLAGIIGAVVNIAANFLLIPQFGIWGAAIATFISFLFLFVLVLVASQRAYHIPYQKGRLATMTILAVCLYVVALFVNPANIWVSLVVKFLIALSFPFLLYLLRFYSPEEVEKLRSMWMRAGKVVRNGISAVRAGGSSNPADREVP